MTTPTAASRAPSRNTSRMTRRCTRADGHAHRELALSRFDAVRDEPIGPDAAKQQRQHSESQEQHGRRARAQHRIIHERRHRALPVQRRVARQLEHHAPDQRDGGGRITAGANGQGEGNFRRLIERHVHRRSSASFKSLLRTSATTATTDIHPGQGKRICPPTALLPGQNRLAAVSLTMATGAPLARSASVKARPCRIGIPIARKKSGVTFRNSKSSSLLGSVVHPSIHIAMPWFVWSNGSWVVTAAALTAGRRGQAFNGLPDECTLALAPPHNERGVGSLAP